MFIPVSGLVSFKVGFWLSVFGGESLESFEVSSILVVKQALLLLNLLGPTTWSPIVCIWLQVWV